jgi:1-phosphofructokinase
MKSKFDVLTVTLNPAIDMTLWVPSFHAGSVNRATITRTDAGGKGVNVAVVLADYGLNVAASGFLGRDNAGIFDDTFRKRSVHSEFVRIAGSTRTGIKIVDPTTSETTDINQCGETPGPDDLSALLNLIHEVDAEWVVLAGSLPPGVPAEVYRDLTWTLKARGRRVAVDTSGEPLRLALEAGPDIVKPNVLELADLLGRSLESPDDILQASRDLLGKGVALAIVSLGAEGAYFVTGDECLLARPPHVDVVSTVGAGDAMVAGAVAARIARRSLADLARQATVFSIEAVTRVGSGMSCPSDTKLRESDVEIIALSQFAMSR